MNLQIISVRFRVPIAVLIAILAATPRLFFLDVPFERDEGTYAYIADVIEHGGLPYLDAFDHKPPAVYYIYSLAFRLFGHVVSSPRLLAFLFVSAAGIALFMLIQRMTQRFLPAVFATILFGLATSSPAYTGFNSNTEIFTLPFLGWGLWFLLDDDPPPMRYALAGLLFGMGLMVKQPVAIIACTTFICKGTMLLKYPRRLAINALVYATGMFIPFAAFAAYFAAKGGLAAFWNDSFSYNFNYIAVLSWRQSLPILVNAINHILYLDPFTLIAGIVGGGVFLAGRARNSHKLYFLAGFVGTGFATAMGKYFYGHYFVFLLLFLSAGAGLGLASLMNGRLSKVSVAGAMLILLASGFVLTPFFVMPAKNLLHICYGFSPFHQSVTLGQYLKKTSLPNATAYIIGSEPQILFYGGLTSPTRVFYFYPLMTQSRHLSKLRDETLAELQRCPPDYLITVNNHSSHFINSLQGNLFLIRLFHFFAPYRLTALSTYDHSGVITGLNELCDDKLLNNASSILVFKRPSGIVSPTGITFGGFVQIPFNKER